MLLLRSTRLALHSMHLDDILTCKYYTYTCIHVYIYIHTYLFFGTHSQRTSATFLEKLLVFLANSDLFRGLKKTQQKKGNSKASTLDVSCSGQTLKPRKTLALSSILQEWVMKDEGKPISKHLDLYYLVGIYYL